MKVEQARKLSFAREKCKNRGHSTMHGMEYGGKKTHRIFQTHLIVETAFCIINDGEPQQSYDGILCVSGTELVEKPDLNSSVPLAH